MASLLERLEKERLGANDVVTRLDSTKEKKNQLGQLKEKIREKLVQMVDKDQFDKDKIEEKIGAVVDEVMREDDIQLQIREKQRLLSEIIDEIVGLGPITIFINDPEVTEVMVNGAGHVYIEKYGKLEKTNAIFRDDSQVLHVIERIVTPIGRRVDEASPMVDARLPDGSRVNAIIPPLALNGPVLTIRKFSRDPFNIDDLISFGTLTPQMAKFLKCCVRARLNILVSGGTGSGKTTTLNVLSTFIPEDERIITIEDAAELQLHQEHVIRLETKPANLEGKGQVGVRDLVRNSLRMRPDRIVVGEVRSGEALDMLQAMNTGHDGSLTTGHANSPRDMLARLETMVLMAGLDIPLKAIREQVSSAIDIIVQQTRFKDGSRKITHIVEVQGMESDVITLQDVFNFKSKGRDDKGRIIGDFVCAGVRPRMLERFEEAGVVLPTEMLKSN
jgi:pilus assembly protein CpaF